MKFSTFISGLSLGTTVTVSGITHFPPELQGMTLVRSNISRDVSLSFKETYICENTSNTKAYSGYVHLAANATEFRAYDTNMFFWFFEAREDPCDAPLALWLQGGPGVPSITAALGENGPCSIANDSKTTVPNPWSWNNVANMLYVDQPIQVGFSYDRLVNGTINQLVSPVNVTIEDFSTTGIPSANATFLAGTFASQDPSATANTTTTAVHAVWHLLQTFLTEFPKYQPPHQEFSIWTESYGGHWGPALAELIEEKNVEAAVPLRLTNLGIINGCVDILTQIRAYPQMAYNNTYGLQFINETQYTSALDSFSTCHNLTQTCRSSVALLDPYDIGASSTANTACYDAYVYCFRELWAPYDSSQYDVFDFSQSALDPFPPKWVAGYLNQAEIQQALGVPLNFTGESLAVSHDFTATGDFVRGKQLEQLGQLLDQGVQITLVYGDRDYQCNWIGGEDISLAVDSSFTSGFHSAGYTDFHTNDTYIGGAVRQYGNFSFTRVFEAGHEVPFYQPETAFKIFNRSISHSDIATGQFSNLGPAPNGSVVSTQGPSSAFHIKNEVPEPYEQICYLWDVVGTCTDDQIGILGGGRGDIKDYILVGET